MTSLVKRLALALHHRITAKIVVAILAGMGAVGLMQGHLMDRAEEAWLMADLRAQATAAAEAVHGAFAAGAAGIAGEERRRLLEALRHTSGAARVAVTDSSGRIVLSSNPGEEGTRIDTAPGDEWHDEETDVHRFVVPLHRQDCDRTDPAGLAGLAGLVVDQDSALHRAHLYAAHGALAYWRVAAMVVVTGLVLVVIWVVVQWPLSRLMAAVTRIEQGDMDVHCQAPAGDEFGRFAAGINAMLASLRAQNRELALMHETRMAQADRLASMGQLASGLAHEIKNPLHAVNSVLSVLRGRADPATGAIIAETQGHVQRVIRAVAEMLTYARPRPFRFELCDLRQVVNRAVALLNADIQARGIRLEQEAAPDLPQTRVDQEKMQQVYVNLLLNAIQAIGKGGCVRITLAWDPATNLITSRVQDDGPGIPAEVAARLFEPFVTSKKGGHGLGLATSRMLVERNSGLLRLVPGTPKGACFEIVLPVIAGDEPAPAPAQTGADAADAGLDAQLFGLACRCPTGGEERCPIEAIRRVRLLELTQRCGAVRQLDTAQKAQALNLHRQCRLARRGLVEDAPPPVPALREGGLPS
jgi:signal transduction histidine kinase